MGQVPLNLAQYLKSVSLETVREAMQAFLAQQFAHLGETRPAPYGDGLILGERYLVQTVEGLVQVTCLIQRTRRADETNARALMEAVTNLLSGLAGLRLQRELGRQVIAAGYPVEQMRQAPNGALILEVEL
jgi:hypothetical protein